MRGAPIGNTNAQKGKFWNDNLRRAIASDKGARVLKAAQKLLDEAANGQPWAIKELADRLDGKAQNECLFDFGHEQLPRLIQVSFISPNH
jgi:hypothetical protein